MVVTRSMRIRLQNSNNAQNQTTAQQRFSGLNVSTINIIDGRQGRLEMICKTLQRHEIDIGVLTETKLNGIHTINSYGYSIMASKGSNGHQGGVAFVVRENKHWHVEGFKTYGANVIKCTLVHHDKRTILIGIYIPPSDVTLESTSYLDEALRNESAENTVVLGDFNVNFDDPKDDRQSEIVDAILTYDLRNLAKQFKCKRNKPPTWTWRQR